MQITGKIVNVLPVESAVSKSGTQWKKQAFIVEYGDRYPKKVAIWLWNANIDKHPVRIGLTVTAHVEPESKEHNGRYYTEIQAWKVDGLASAAPAPAAANMYAPAPAATNDELPF